MSKPAVTYHSATGNGTAIAAGAGVRHMAETRDPPPFAQNPPCTASHEATNPLDEATPNALDHLARRIAGVADRLS